MGFLGFGRQKEAALFPDRETLSGKSWTTTDLVMDALNARREDIYMLQLGKDVADAAEKAAGELTPSLRLYSIYGYLCYAEKDERRLFDFLENFEKDLQPAPPPAPARPEPEKKVDLTDLIKGANNQQEAPPKEAPDFLRQMGLADPEPEPEDLPPTDRENRWAAERIIEELTEADQDEGTKDEPATDGAGSGEPKQRKKRRSLGRNNQIKTRLTDAELTQFQRRVKRSGLSQGDFCGALPSPGVIEERSYTDVAVLDELALLRAELGRQGGLLKMIIKPNEGQRELAPDEWAELIGAVRGMEKLKGQLTDLEVKITHGDSKAQDQQKRPVR